MKKILLSLSVVAAVAVVVVGATTAFFSDTETSTGNTFTAGELDLLVDIDGIIFKSLLSEFIKQMIKFCSFLFRKSRDTGIPLFFLLV